MKTINKILDTCNLILAGIGGIVILLLILAVCFSTLSRYIANKPFAFLTDFATYSLLFVAFLGAPWLMQKRGHTCIDMLTNAMKEGMRKKWQCIIDIFVALVAFIFCYIGVLVTMDAFNNATALTDTFGTPKWILLACIPLGCFFLGIQCIRNAVLDVTQKEGGDQ